MSEEWHWTVDEEIGYMRLEDETGKDVLPDTLDVDGVTPFRQRLIAAAPELLEALEDMLVNTEPSEMDRVFRARACEILSRIRNGGSP